MLYLMRKHATSWMIKVVLILVALSFVAWGGYRIREQRLIRVATVNGDTITAEEYRESYRSLLEQLKKTFGNSLNEEMLKVLNVDKQAIDRLIAQRLLIQEAEKLNFRVTDQELSDTIRSIPAFQRAGIFDSRRYRTVLNTARLNPETFEAIQKKSMLVEKLRSFITDTVKISDTEAWEWFKWQNVSVDIDVLLFEPEKYKIAEVSAEEIEKYFGDHKSSYKTEPKLKVRYLFFDPTAYIPDVRIPKEEINDYYSTYPEEFKTPKTVEARHILIKVPPEATEEVVESTKTRASDVLKLAREGKDFAELAKKYSEGPTKDSGGYLGTFEKNAMVEPFANKAFSMKAGEISEPVRTQFGWHIIKVEKVNEASVLPPEKAKETIRKKLTDEKAKTMAYDRAESVYETIFDGDDLTKIAKERNLTVRTSDYFTRNGPVKDVKNPTGFASVAFGLSVMQISEIQDFGDGFYVLQVVEKIPEKIPDLKQVEAKVRDDLIKEKQREKASAEATAFLKALKDGKSVSEESKKFGVTPIKTGFFKRNASIPNVGYESGILDAAFKLSKKKNLPENPIKGQKGYYVIRFTERKDPEMEAFNTEKATVKDSLEQLKMRKSFDAWLATVRNNSEITIEKRFSDSQ